jgi:hypothetical protein
MGLEQRLSSEQRINDRIPVFYRTRGIGPDEQLMPLVIVDLSAKGLMARCEGDFAAEAPIQVSLPMIGTRPARIRWSLGGRIGCEFDTPIGIEDYFEMLNGLVRMK